MFIRNQNNLIPIIFPTIDHNYHHNLSILFNLINLPSIIINHFIFHPLFHLFIIHLLYFINYFDIIHIIINIVHYNVLLIFFIIHFDLYYV